MCHCLLVLRMFEMGHCGAGRCQATTLFKVRLLVAVRRLYSSNKEKNEEIRTYHWLSDIRPFGVADFHQWICLDLVRPLTGSLIEIRMHFSFLFRHFMKMCVYAVSNVRLFDLKVEINYLSRQIIFGRDLSRQRHTARRQVYRLISRATG